VRGNLSGIDLKGAKCEGARYNSSTELPFSREEAEERGMVFVGKDEPLKKS